MNKIDIRKDHNPHLTDEERAAIAAFPESKVQKIPFGQSSNHERFVWCSKSNNLRQIDEKGEMLGRDAALKRMKGRFKPRRTANSGTNAGHERARCIGTVNREKVAKAIEAGCATHADIMAATGLSTSTVSVHLKALGINLIHLKAASKRLERAV